MNRFEISSLTPLNQIDQFPERIGELTEFLFQLPNVIRANSAAPSDNVCAQWNPFFGQMDEMLRIECAVPWFLFRIIAFSWVGIHDYIFCPDFFFDSNNEFGNIVWISTVYANGKNVWVVCK